MSRSPTVAAVALGSVYGKTPAEVLALIAEPADVWPALLRELQSIVEDSA